MSNSASRRLQPAQPILLIYGDPEAAFEVFGEVILLEPFRYLVRLYGRNGSPGSIRLVLHGRTWFDETKRRPVSVIEELSGAQLSTFMIYRDYSLSGCALRRQSPLKGLRASA